MSVLEQRLEDVKRGYVEGDFSTEDFEAEVERIVANPYGDFVALTPFRVCLADTDVVVELVWR